MCFCPSILKRDPSHDSSPEEPKWDDELRRRVDAPQSVLSDEAELEDFVTQGNAIGN
jgi:hypothetical protein